MTISSRTRIVRSIALCGVVALTVVTLAACSSSSSSSSTSSAAASSSGVGGNVLPPIMVEPGQDSATAKVGDFVVFKQPDPAKTKISTDNTAVLEVSQGSDDGSATFNPGAKALSPGTAVVTIVAADGSTSTVTVTVTA